MKRVILISLLALEMIIVAGAYFSGASADDNPPPTTTTTTTSTTTTTILCGKCKPGKDGSGCDAGSCPVVKGEVGTCMQDPQNKKACYCYTHKDSSKNSSNGSRHSSPFSIPFSSPFKIPH
jgi:hypothetical protein